MIAASTYLPSASSSTIAASSIHGTGAQNFSSAMRNGCTLVSGIAFGPHFSSRRRASPLVRPSGDAPNFFSTSGRGRDFKSSIALGDDPGFDMGASGWSALGFVTGILSVFAMPQDG